MAAHPGLVQIVNCVIRDKKTRNRILKVHGGLGLVCLPPKRSLPVKDYFLLLKFFFPSPVSLSIFKLASV